MKNIYTIFEKISKPLEKVILTLAGIGMALIALIIFLQVVFRVILSNSLSWTEEIARYLEVWVVFLTAGYALGKGQHISMDLLTHLLPERITFVLGKVCAAACVCFSGLCIYYSYKYMMSESYQMFASLPVSKAVVYLAMVVGFVLCTFYSLMNLARPKGVKP